MRNDDRPSIPRTASNVIAVGPPHATASRALYERWTATLDDADGPVRVVVLTYLREPRTYAERLAAVTDRSTERVVIDARDQRSENGADDFGRVVAAAPNDLTRLGIHVSEFVDDWDGEVYFLLDSLTTLLQFVEVETAYRFLHVLTSRMTAADARAVYLFHGRRHDEQVTSVFTQLVDASLTYDRETETWALSAR